MYHQYHPSMMYYSGSSLRQRGYGLAMYSRYARFGQKGRGLGSWFGNVIKRVIPFAKNTILPAAKKYILPHAKEMAKNVAADVLTSDQPFRESLRQHGLAALKGVGTSILQQSGSGLEGMCMKRRKCSGYFKAPKTSKRRKVTKTLNRKRRKPQSRRKRKRQRRSIFD